MNETLTFGICFGGRRFTRSDILSGAFGGQFVRAVTSKQPALWFFGSLFLRTSIMPWQVFTLYRAWIIGRGCLICLLGFVHGALYRDMADAARQKE